MMKIKDKPRYSYGKKTRVKKLKGKDAVRKYLGKYIKE